MTMRFDIRGWLLPGFNSPKVVAFPSVRTSPLEEKAPLGLVWHTTGGVGGSGWAEGLVRRIQGYRKGVDRPASWHFLIAKDGTIYQSAPIHVGTWHVGVGGDLGGRSFKNINHGSIGVELENAGQLIGHDGQFYAWPVWKAGTKDVPDPKLRIDPTRVVIHELKAFDGFPTEQITSASELAGCLVKTLQWEESALCHGHADFAAPRKIDPGPLWMKEILPRVLERIALGKDGVK